MMADTTKAASQAAGGANGLVPTDLLKREIQALLKALGQRAVQAATQRVTDATGRLTEYAENGGGPGLMAAVRGAKSLSEGKSPVKAALSGGVAGMKEKVKDAAGGGGKGSQGKKSLKVTNIVETIDVGVPVRDAYNVWTQFTDFPSYMKKVESVEQESDEKLNWTAQILWSHRTWKATIAEQIPDKRIVWRSEGSKGHVDGAVSFHELAPDLTRVLVVLEYYPQGFFEYTGNLWRAQGRRARLELKHFRRHVMTNAILNPEEIEGWRGEIRDGEVVKDHETAIQEEKEAQRDEGDEEDRGEEDRGEEDRGEEDRDEEDRDEEDRDEEDRDEEDRGEEDRGEEDRDEEDRDEEDRGRSAQRRRGQRQRPARRESEDAEPERERERVPASRGRRR